MELHPKKSGNKIFCIKNEKINGSDCVKFVSVFI